MFIAIFLAKEQSTLHLLDLQVYHLCLGLCVTKRVRIGVTVGLVNTHFALLPIPAIIQAPRRVDPHGQSWNRLKTAIDLPELI